MVNRITTAAYYSAVLADLMTAQDRENTANQQVATGKLGNDLMSFGSQTRNIIATQTVKARVDGMVTQLNNLKVKMNFQQSAVQQVSDVASQLKNSLTNALASGQGDSIMNDVQSYFSQAAQALNTQYGGDYLFSGGQTQTKPFTAPDLATLTTQPSTAAFFKDGTLVPNSQIADNTSVQTGFQATTLGKSLMDAFQSIQGFQQSGSGNFGGPLTSAQETFLTNVIQSLGTVVTATTQTTAQGGDMQARVESAITAQTDRQATLKTTLGDMTDVNMAEAASNLTQAQTAVQASAQVFMTLKSMSLLNYLSAGSFGG
jgi:flagellar hook-associated protein 3 FlgL